MISHAFMAHNKILWSMYIEKRKIIMRKVKLCVRAKREREKKRDELTTPKEIRIAKKRETIRAHIKSQLGGDLCAPLKHKPR